MMICDQLHSLIGANCMSLCDDGSVAVVTTPFRYDDGDEIHCFVERIGSSVRFFDDGDVLMHFRGRGLQLADQRNTKFIRTAGEPYDVSLTSDGEIEIWSTLEDAPAAYAKFMSTMVAICRWEREQRGVSTDIALLIDEIAILLQAWKPNADLVVSPAFVGISTEAITFDFAFEGKGVLAVAPHHLSVNSAIRKLVDVRGAPVNHDLEFMVILDDRQDKTGAHNDRLLFTTMASVLPMTTLVKQASFRG